MHEAVTGQDPTATSYTTPGGVEVSRTAAGFDPALMAGLAEAAEQRRGGVLSSGMEYPGRYSRWEVAYVDPCVEVVARGRLVTARALNERGAVVFGVIDAALRRVGRPADDPSGEDGGDGGDSGDGGLPSTTVLVPAAEGSFTEEERSRQPTVFSALREIIAAFAGPDPNLGLYGAFGYDLAFQFEPVRMRIPRDGALRDLVLHLPDQVYVVDRKRESAVCHSYEFSVAGRSTAGLPRETAASPGAAARGPSTVDQERDLPGDPVPGEYAALVGRARERFAQGDLFEVVPGHVFHARCSSPAAFYQRLRERNPAPYEFFLNLGEGEYLVAASPEMYVRVTGSRVETCPISGTIARGSGPLEDADNIRALLNSAKDESELTMCTDVDRNDKSRICEPGSVAVIGRRQIEMYSRLIHTVDHVEGRLRPGFDALDAFLTHMWAVTVTGAPKTWAMQFIEDNEASARRWYGGAAGMVGFDGAMSTGLTLRTAHIVGGVAAVRAGATLLFDSDPDAEEAETHLKARALLEILRLSQDGPGNTTAGDGAGQSDAAALAGGPGAGLSVLLVDHQDSFVHTLAGYFREHGATVTTLRAGFPAARLDEFRPDLVVLSPGPGRPADFGCQQLLDELDARGLPVFGVCLGLQAMVEHAGGELGLLDEPAHGKPGTVQVRGGALLAGLPEEFTAGRYHSLHARPEQVKGFEVTAVTPDGVVMAIEDAAAGRWGVQFHPESILTASGRAGHRVVANVLALCQERRRAGRASAPRPAAPGA
jgi:anthranilate synthase